MISVLLSPDAENHELIVELERIGAKAIKWRQIKIGPPDNFSALDDAIENLFGYDWLVLKNPDAARCFLHRFAELNHKPDELDNLRVCVIGENTAALIRESQIHMDIEIESSNQTFAAIESYVGDSDSISALNLLAPSANVTRELFQNQFEAAGARVDSVTAYRTTSDPQALAQLNALLIGGGVDCLLFRNTVEITEFGQLFDTDDLARILHETSVICADQPAQAASAEFQLIQTMAPAEPTTAAITHLIASSGSGLRS